MGKPLMVFPVTTATLVRKSNALGSLSAVYL